MAKLVPLNTTPVTVLRPTRVESRYEGTRTSIRDCPRGCSNRAQMCPQLSAIDVTAKTFFERLYLVLGLRKIAPWVNCPYAPTTPTVHSTSISRFLCNFFPRMAPHFFGHHDSPSNLAESRYPPHPDFLCIIRITRIDEIFNSIFWKFWKPPNFNLSSSFQNFWQMHG